MDIKEFIERYRRNEKFEYLFFWGHKGEFIGKNCLSQWFSCDFVSDGVKYHTAEQYMMAQKAMLFGDKKIYDEIMAADEPSRYKSLGRKISGFDDKIWNENKKEIVFKGNMAKFSQNNALKAFLFSTRDKILVEASPYDKIWGIGMSRTSDGIENPENWQGENILGFVLTEVKENLKKSLTL